MTTLILAILGNAVCVGLLWIIHVQDAEIVRLKRHIARLNCPDCVMTDLVKDQAEQIRRYYGEQDRG
jgi:hypothetical protein